MKKELFSLLYKFRIISPILILLFFFLQFTKQIDSFEFSFSIDDYIFIILAIVLMLVNSIVNFILWKFDKENYNKNKFIKYYSIFLGTPILLIILISGLYIYAITFEMRYEMVESKYLTAECYTKYKYIFMANHRYQYGEGYCPSATQDQIIVTEVYRTGNIKSCGIILQDVYYKKDTSEITFLTTQQKKELFAY